MNYGFTLVEVLIVVAILGILAAIALPEFSNASQQAKEAAAKENLQTLRSAIGRYALNNNDIAPGYAFNNSQSTPSIAYFNMQMAKGKYIVRLPENPFNHLCTLDVLSNDAQIPNEATGKFGWIYKPNSKTILLDWPGVDTNNKKYLDY